MITAKLQEPLLSELSQAGKQAYTLRKSSIKEYHKNLDGKFTRTDVDLPELSEVEVVRHFTRLSTKNYGVDTGMYPLGSCTMKYNPKINEDIAAKEGLAYSHPLFGEEQAQGSLEIIYTLQELLKTITGFSHITLNPMAGAQAELAGILITRAYFEDKKEKRHTILVPDLAHGTNPASAALGNFKTQEIKCGKQGILEASLVEQYMTNDIAALMITNPNTLGLFEEEILKITKIVHDHGGLVYMDGANLNALLGITKIAPMGVDLMHINLHKTFSTPHGGGGPGAGPLCVNEKLSPYLPIPLVTKNGTTYSLITETKKSIGRMGLFQGNFGILVRALTYILSLGNENIKKVSEAAIIAANYIKEHLKNDYHLPYTKDCMHECIFTDKFQKENGVTTLNIAKSLLDYGIHPPTVYFPLVVSGALMIEPTECESKRNLDHFISVMKELAADAKTNPDKLKNAPRETPVKRVDEVNAVKNLVLTWKKIIS